MSVARIGCADVGVEDVLNVIMRSAESTESGAGKIWVLPVEAVVRVSTGSTRCDPARGLIRRRA
ncbi:P-II family nitrogen regulator [Candidatus Frankia alpina]|uniref:P-II family nitrogen regulator n=1 Tax=Candidatus Frankia alpina TaxID=2699483 RepID=UPI003AF8ADA6